MKQTSKIVLGESKQYPSSLGLCYWAEAAPTLPLPSLIGCKWPLSMALAGKINRGDEGDSFGMGFKFPWLKKIAEKVQGK